MVANHQSHMNEMCIRDSYNIDIETFQALARYDAEGNYYPWRPLNTNDFVLIWYYNVDPEVTAYAVNPDGTKMCIRDSRKG